MAKGKVLSQLVIILFLVLIVGVTAIQIEKSKYYDKDMEEISIYAEDGSLDAVFKLYSNTCDDNKRFCNATLSVIATKDFKFYDSIDFYKVLGNNLVSGKVRWYEIYYSTQGKKIDSFVYGWACYDDSGKIDKKNMSSNCSYGILDTVKTDAPDWTLYSKDNANKKLMDKNKEQIFLIKAEKRPSWSIDWILNSFGVTLDEWATWGNISEGDDAEVILNYPADGSTSYINPITFNASINLTGGLGIVNVSLLSNKTGIWEVENTTLIDYNITTIQDIAPYSFLQTAETVATTGLKFRTKTTGSLVNVEKSSNSTPTSVYLTTADGAYTVLATGTFVGNHANFSYNMTNDTLYCIVAKSETYTRTSASASYPQEGVYVDWINGVYNEELTQNNAYNFLSVNITNAVTTSVTNQSWNVTLLNDTSWWVMACDSDGVCLTNDSSEIRTLYIDKTLPIINVTENLTKILNSTGNYTLNFSATDINLDSCWFNYNGSNQTVVCSTGVDIQANVTKSFPENIITIYANDTNGRISSTQINIPFDYPTFTIISPSGTTVSASIVINYSINSIGNINYTYYNISRGASVEKANAKLTSIDGFYSDTYTLTGEGTYVINFWANTTTGIFNQSNLSLTYADGVVVVDGASAGGGGNSIIASLLQPEPTPICTPLYPVFKTAWNNFLQDISFTKFKIAWFSFWSYSLCESSASIVPVVEFREIGG